MIRQKLFIGIIALFLFLAGVGNISPVQACAGYTISVGSTGTLQQDLLTQILSLLISQRTGTNIKRVSYNSQAEMVTAAGRHQVDLLVADLGAAGQQPFSELGLVPLEPFGYRDAQIIPVFHPETLKRFPALKRLVNRLNGLIDDQTMERLEAAATDSNLRDVAHKFLSEQKLIFGR